MPGFAWDSGGGPMNVGPADQSPFNVYFGDVSGPIVNVGDGEVAGAGYTEASGEALTSSPAALLLVGFALVLVIKGLRK